MEKSKKTEIVEKIRSSCNESEAVFVVNQNKMTVAETENLRKQLRSVNSKYLVAKNTLARIAVKDTSFECITEELKGQMSLVFSKDITGAAKVISEYSSKSDDKLKIICGGYQERLLSFADVKTLASLPSMDELRAKIIAMISTPAQRIAMVTQAPAGQLARVLKAYSEKN